MKPIVNRIGVGVYICKRENFSAEWIEDDRGAVIRAAAVNLFSQLVFRQRLDAPIDRELELRARR